LALSDVPPPSLDLTRFVRGERRLAAG